MLKVGPDQQQKYFSSLMMLSVRHFWGGRCWDSVPIGRDSDPTLGVLLRLLSEYFRGCTGGAQGEGVRTVFMAISARCLC